jgi:peptidoglycan/LPS O-acetylase OafA/YrhL
MVVDVQSVVGIFRNDPAFYNLVSYAICGALILCWTVKVVRSRITPAAAWYAIAAIVPLTMLVTYHKPYDVKLILLLVPACILLWAESNRIGQAALLLTAGAIVFTADIPLGVYAALTDSIHPDTNTLSGKLIEIVILRPVSIILIELTAFYLSIFLRRPTAGAGDPHLATPDQA